MEELINLKNELDKIDNSMMNAVVDGFYNSRLRILIGMWDKGKIIAQFTGVDCANYRELQRITDRSDHSLKLWHDLYKNNIERKKYIEKVAKPKAQSWAQKALANKVLALPQNSEDSKEITLLEKAISAYQKLSEEEKLEFKKRIA